jgi:hypothetical protein
MNPVVANESELYIERGGPAYRLMQRIGLIRGDDPSVARRIIAFLAVTWLPLLVLSSWEGLAIGPTPRESFLLDFAAFARFLVAVPLLFIAEVTIGLRVTTAGLHFLRADLVRPEDYPAFEQAIRRLARWRESLGAEVVLVGIAVIGAWTFTAETVYGGATASWHTATVATGNGTHLSLVGLWYHVVSVPILQFFWYRWLWRYLIWIRFLYDVCRLKLDLVPTHADGAGGLGFLGTTHTVFGILTFAMSSVLSAAAAFVIIFEGVQIEAFQVHFVTVLVITEVVILGPLAMFCPALVRARQAWIRQYSLLVLRYNRAFHEKWIEGQGPEGEPLLGSADIQSLADLGNSFEFIRGMKVVPFSVRVMLQLAVVTLLPALPLVLLVVPIEKILDLMTKAVF